MRPLLATALGAALVMSTGCSLTIDPESVAPEAGGGGADDRRVPRGAGRAQAVRRAGLRGLERARRRGRRAPGGARRDQLGFGSRDTGLVEPQG